MNNIQLIINTPSNATLDLKDKYSVSLQYSIADIRDIKKRNNAYSKTIKLPGTKNNNYWLGNLFDINSDFTLFNLNRKTDATLLINSETVLKGFLQLKKINKLVNTDTEGNEIEYEIVLYNNTVDLITELGDKKLNELDLSNYDHVYDWSGVTNSWTNTYQDGGYVYPMYGVQDNTPIYRLDNFYPAMFYKTILDQIINEAGYGWTGSLYNDEHFEKEIIPYMGDGLPKLSLHEKNKRSFSSKSISGTYSFPDIEAADFLSKNYPDVEYPMTDDIVTDDYNLWDNVNNIFEVVNNGKYTINYNLNYDLELINNNVNILGSTASPIEYTIKHKIQLKQNGTNTWVDVDIHQITISQLPPILLPNIPMYESFDFSHSSPVMNLGVGDKVRIRISGSKSDGFYAYNYIAEKVDINLIINSGKIWNTVNNTSIMSGDIVKWSNFLSSKLKQKDIITDLIKRYNIFIQIDPDNDKMVILDKRNDYYDKNDRILNWTDKKDFSTQDTITILSELQSKEINFKYKDGSDEYNKQYKEITDENYGSYKYIFDNDFIQGETNIETPFNATPLVKSSFNAILPSIDPEKPKGGPRVLYWGGLRSCDTWVYQATSNPFPIFFPYTEYPYAGHLDDPITPNYDINFGVCNYYFYSEMENITLNNLYNLNWANYMDQIEDGRLLTSKFYLNNTDISYIKDNLNVQIWIKDSYYYINKIFDYKPLLDGLTKVELLKIKKGVKWVEKIETPIYTGSLCPTDIHIVNHGLYFYYESYTGVVSESCCDFLGGEYIQNGENSVCKVKKPPIDIGSPIPPKKTDNNKVILGLNNNSGGSFINKDGIFQNNNYLIVGDGNNVFGNNVNITGDNNSVSSDDVVIINGNDNDINSSGSILIGSTGITSSVPGQIYLGDSFSIDKTTGQVSIDGVVEEKIYKVFETSGVIISPVINDEYIGGSVSGWNSNIYDFTYNLLWTPYFNCIIPYPILTTDQDIINIDGWVYQDNPVFTDANITIKVYSVYMGSFYFGSPPPVLLTTQTFLLHSTDHDNKYNFSFPAINLNNSESGIVVSISSNDFTNDIKFTHRVNIIK